MRFALMICCVLAALAGLLLAGLLAEGAPAPLPRAARCGPLPASCVMVWAGVPYDATFARNGAYAASAGASLRYVGAWHLDGDELVIREALECRQFDAHAWATYRVALQPCRRRGRLPHGEWRLEPPAPQTEDAPERGPAPREVGP